MAIRSTRQYAEILANGDGKARVGRQYAEVLANGSGSARVTRQYVEVLSSVPVPSVEADAGDALTMSDTAGCGFIISCVANDTCVLTEFDTTLACKLAIDTISLGEDATASRINGAVDTVVLSELVHLNVVLSRDESDSLALIESAVGSGVVRLRASDLLSVSDVVSADAVKPVADAFSVTESLSLECVYGFSESIDLADSVDLQVERSAVASDTLSLSDVSEEYFDTGADSLALSDTATQTHAFRVRASDSLGVSDVTTAYTLRSTGEDTLVLAEMSSAIVFPGNISEVDVLTIGELARVARIWPVAATETLQESFEDYDPSTGAFYTIFYGLQDLATVSIVRVPRTASDSLNYLGGRAVGIVIRADAIPAGCEDTITLTDQAWSSITPVVAESVSITEVALALTSKTAADELDITEVATTLLVRVLSAADTLVVTDAILFELPFAGVECQYHPFVGSGPMPSEITGIGTETGFKLCYPPAGPFTDTLTLRNPRFGNRDRVQLNRISRETRGGTLIVFADSIWPKIQTQIYQFEALSWDQANGLFEFIDNHLGLEIGLLDHEGRYWRGIVVTAEEPVTHDGKRGYAVGFEFEGVLASYPV